MIKGFESFKNWFQGFEEQYTIIGGTACDILMAEEDKNPAKQHTRTMKGYTRS